MSYDSDNMSGLMLMLSTRKIMFPEFDLTESSKTVPHSLRSCRLGLLGN